MGAPRRVCCVRWAIGLSMLAAYSSGYAQVSVEGAACCPMTTARWASQRAPN